jgi:hypothetical protein
MVKGSKTAGAYLLQQNFSLLIESFLQQKLNRGATFFAPAYWHQGVANIALYIT